MSVGQILLNNEAGIESDIAEEDRNTKSSSAKRKEQEESENERKRTRKEYNTDIIEDGPTFAALENEINVCQYFRLSLIAVMFCVLVTI